jgi:hypothetical protein
MKFQHPSGERAVVAALKDVTGWFADDVDGAIIGGIAASIRGNPRLTRDIDAVILADDLGWERALESAKRHGLAPRIDDPLGFAARSRMLLLRHVATAIQVDISLGALPFEREAVERSSVVKVGSLRLPLVTAEDLVIMKAVARRPQDIGDIEAVLDRHPNLDLSRIRHHLREFSSVLEMPEIYDDFEKLLRRRNK